MLTVLSLSACSDNTGNPLNNPSDNSSPAPAYFPNNIGNHWTYQFSVKTDSTTGQSAQFRTTIIEITDNSIILDSVPVSVWVWTYPDSAGCSACADTAFVYADSSRAVFYKWITTSQENRELHQTAEFRFPFRAGESWGWDPLTDGRTSLPGARFTGTTLTTDSLFLKGGDFARASLVTMYPNTSGPGLLTPDGGAYWFAPHVGIVGFVTVSKPTSLYIVRDSIGSEEHFVTPDDFVLRQFWELEDYSIASGR